MGPSALSPGCEQSSESRERHAKNLLKLWIQFSRSVMTLCDPMDFSMPGFVLLITTAKTLK